MVGTVLSTTCSARKFHVPPAPYPDSHHVVPRAWQGFWVPEAAVVLLRGDNAGLWHPETVELCPNCHRRVHVYIQALMRSKPALVEDPLSYRKAAWGLNRGLSREQAIAYKALTTFRQVGGSLDALVQHKLYGIQ